MSYSRDILVSPDPEVKAEFFRDKRIRLTDARRVGVMLRDGFLTLRNHSAMTTVRAEVIDARTFKLRATAIGGNNYIRIDDDKFKADADESKAAHFSAKLTALGFELFYNNEAPAIFDRFYDVAIGPWTNTSQRSQTPILMWVGSVAEIWGSHPKPPSPQQQPLPGESNRAMSTLP
ncbi:hypothetical protein QBC42DRAFT_258846 [Cladorrhinum samala]|uniref:Uncharacterized protein n=1 Tax=Cladorrhinum samala TaxID=585594 RepID=A0AAV9I214_9PEZI|nr:hypothetical protein QBC42DRAFT_258846 [Cladorrhinum samala]